VLIPVATSGHPRLFLTADDLPRLRSWATSENPIYQHGMVPFLASLETDYLKRWFNSDETPKTPFPDNGDTNGYTPANCVEMLAVVFAFNALIDPDPAAQIRYGKYARNLVMHGLSLAALGVAAGVPFRDKLFAVSNRMNFGGELWAFVLDWLYDAVDENGAPIFTAADKATARKAFLNWCQLCAIASQAPYPAGLYNNPKILPGIQTPTWGYPDRYAVNNYAICQMRTLTLFGLMLDDADDLPLDPAKPVDAVGNSVRSYLKPALQAWLYKLYAQFGEPDEIAADYGIPETKLGWASGGLPMEGSLYGESIQWLLVLLYSMQTAGCTDQIAIGPQAKMLTLPYWDRFVSAFMSLLPSAAQDMPLHSMTPYLKSTYFYVGAYGDQLRRYCTPDVFRAYATIALMQERQGRADNYEACCWAALNLMPGGAAGILTRCTKPYTSFIEPILYFLLLDPERESPADPRCQWPVDFQDTMGGWLSCRSGWDADASVLTYRSTACCTGHQQQDAGGWQLFRLGEQLSGYMANYSGNAVAQTPAFHNSLSIKNWCQNGTPKNLINIEPIIWDNGGQFVLGAQGYCDPVTVTSCGDDFRYIESDITDVYNRPQPNRPTDDACDVTLATRSILWLHGIDDTLVVYSRVETDHANFKREHFCLPSPTVKPAAFTPPVVTGNLLTTETLREQSIAVYFLLPDQAAISVANRLQELPSGAADMETMVYVATSEPAAPVLSARFLTVFQGSDSAGSPASLVQSDTGTAFDGATFGNVAVLFKRTPAEPFATATVPLPSGVNRVFVLGVDRNSDFSLNLDSGLLTIQAGARSQQSDDSGLLKAEF
jgi:hypothetical protein